MGVGSLSRAWACHDTRWLSDGADYIDGDVVCDVVRSRDAELWTNRYS